MSKKEFLPFIGSYGFVCVAGYRISNLPASVNICAVVQMVDQPFDYSNLFFFKHFYLA